MVEYQVAEVIRSTRVAPSLSRKLSYWQVNLVRRNVRRYQ